MLKLYKNTDQGMKLVDFGVEGKERLYIAQGYMVKVHVPGDKEKVWRRGVAQAPANSRITVTHRVKKPSLWARAKNLLQSLVPQPAFAYA